MKRIRNISCVLIYLVPYLNPMTRIMYAYWETLMQHQVHRDLTKCITCYMRMMWCLETRIFFPDNTYTHVNNGSQTSSYLDHMAMSDVLSESTVDCNSLQDVACPDHCAITIALNFDQLSMTHTIERHKNKHINWKFEYIGLKRGFSQRLDYIC